MRISAQVADNKTYMETTRKVNGGHNSRKWLARFSISYEMGRFQMVRFLFELAHKPCTYFQMLGLCEFFLSFFSLICQVMKKNCGYCVIFLKNKSKLESTRINLFSVQFVQSLYISIKWNIQFQTKSIKYLRFNKIEINTEKWISLSMNWSPEGDCGMCASLTFHLLKLSK